MARIRIQLVPEFKGDTVILVTMDGSGLDCLKNALGKAVLQNSATCEATSEAPEQAISMSDRGAFISVGRGKITWILTPEKALEVIDKLEGMRSEPAPNHNFVDIDGDAPVLYLSKNEYT